MSNQTTPDTAPDASLGATPGTAPDADASATPDAASGIAPGAAPGATSTPDAPEKQNFIVSKATGRTRFIATVPAIGLLIASFVLALGTLVSLVVSSYKFVIGEIELHKLAIEYVEGADLFLLAVALYILSIGLVNLFVSERIELPDWLNFHDFNDLKERLTGVIVVMIGVYF